MPDWLSNLLFWLLVAVIIGGAVAGIVRSHRYDVANTRHCMERGYGGWFRYAPAGHIFCIGVIDGEWRIKPVELEE